MTDNQPRKQWSCPKERKAHYAKQYQLRMAKEDSPQGERWREKRREESRRSRAKKAANREAKKPKVQPVVKRRPFDQAIQPRALQPTEPTPAKPELMSSFEWERAGGKVERLPVNWQTPVVRRSCHIALY